MGILVNQSNTSEYNQKIQTADNGNKKPTALEQSAFFVLPQDEYNNTSENIDTFDLSAEERKKLLIESFDSKLGITLQDIESFLERAFNLTKYDLYNKISDNLLAYISARILGGLNESLTLEKDPNFNKNNFLTLTAFKYKNLKNEGKTLKEIADYHCEFGDDSFIDYINKRAKTKYATVSELLSDEENLNKIIDKIIDECMDYKNFESNALFIEGLLIFATTDKDIKGDQHALLYNKILEKLSNKSEKLNRLTQGIRILGKKSPEDLQKFLSNTSLLAALKEAGLDNSLDIARIVQEIIKGLSGESSNILDGIHFLLNLITNNNDIKSRIKDKINNKQPLTEDEKNFVRAQKLIKKKISEGLSPEEENELKKLNINNTIESFVAALTVQVNNQRNLAKNQYGADSVKDIDQEIIAICKQVPTEKLVEAAKAVEKVNPDFKIDTTFLDELTDGKFSQALKEYELNHPDKDSDFGHKQKISSEECTAIRANIDNKTQEFYNLYNTNENKFYIEKNETNKRNSASNKSLITNPQGESIKTLKGYSVKDICEGLNNNKFKIVDVFNQYNNLSQQGKDFVENLIKRKSSSMQIFYLNSIKNNNSAVVNIIVNLKLYDDKYLNKVILDFNSKKEIEHIKKEKEKENKEPIKV